MAAKLIAEDGPAEGLTLELESGEEWVLGSNKRKADLVIEDPAAAAKQVLCRKTPKGITIENLSPTTTIRVNDEVVEEPLLLRDDDTVQIGDTLFRFASVDIAEADTLLDEEDEPDAMQGQEDTILEETEFPEDSLAKIHFDLGSTGRWVLKVIAGPNTGAEIAMEAGGKYLIGTDTGSCDVVFQDVSVSRQHAQINIGRDERVIIQDLESRNGVLIDGEPIEDEEELGSSNVVTVGTTAFVVYDTEGESATIVSPLIPKAPQSESISTPSPVESADSSIDGFLSDSVASEKPKVRGSISSGIFSSIFLLVAALGLFGAIGWATTTLFQDEDVIKKEDLPDPTIALDKVMGSYPGVKYTYNKNSGILRLAGHVLTAEDHSQLRYDISNPSFQFIRRLDDSVVIDELVWQETNQILAKNREWRGVTVRSKNKIPGQFVVTGSMQTQEQYETLIGHLNRNFPYLDRLDKKIIVEEAIVSQADSMLRDRGFTDITVSIANGDITLSGTMSYEQTETLDKTLAEIRTLDGVKNLKNFVVELEPEQAMVDLTGQYEITGYSMRGSTSINVVINGRILSRGDTLDGMTVTSIRSNSVFLEKDGFKFRIDYSP